MARTKSAANVVLSVDNFIASLAFIDTANPERQRQARLMSFVGTCAEPVADAQGSQCRRAIEYSKYDRLVLRYPIFRNGNDVEVLQELPDVIALRAAP